MSKGDNTAPPTISCVLGAFMGYKTASSACLGKRTSKLTIKTNEIKNKQVFWFKC